MMERRLKNSGCPVEVCDRGEVYPVVEWRRNGAGGAAHMNIQALLGARPAAGSSRRSVSDDKGRDRVRVGPTMGEPQDVVELSVEGKERAAADADEGHA